MAAHCVLATLTLLLAGVSCSEAFGWGLTDRLFGEEYDEVVQDSRIVGGYVTSIRRAPFMVSLLNRRYEDRKRVAICGGCIVTERFILTAGHCGNNANTSTLQIRSGSSYLFSGGQEHRAKAIHVHPKFNDTTLDYDITVIEVDPPFMFNNKTQTIEIGWEEPKAGDIVDNYGWGVTEYQGEISKQLRTVATPVVSRQKCEESYKRIRNARVTARMFCSGSEGKDHCGGDSGGAIVNHHGDLVGLVSWAVRCAEKQYPGVAADLTNHEMRDFVAEKAYI